MRFATKFVAALAATAGFSSASVLLPRGSLVDVCANVDIDLEILGIVFGHIDVCLCISALPVFVQTNVVAILAAEVEGVDAVIAALEAQINSSKGAQRCVYPDNCTPLCSDDCDFDCKPPYVKHGSKCVLPPSTGFSKRGMDLDEDIQCAWGLTKCGALNVAASRAGFECLDTRTHLESCGGCTLAYGHNEATGQDCTAIPGVSGVSCQANKCVVHSCKRGWVQRADSQGVKGCVMGAN